MTPLQFPTICSHTHSPFPGRSRTTAPVSKLGTTLTVTVEGRRALLTARGGARPGPRDA